MEEENALIRVTTPRGHFGLTPLAVLLIAALTTLIDILFHYFETDPFELPAYFLGILIFAIVGALLIPHLGLLISAFTFSGLKVVYNVVAVYFNIPGLTILTQKTITINGFGPSISQYYTAPALEYGILWFFIHAIMFIVASAIVLFGLGRKT